MHTPQNSGNTPARSNDNQNHAETQHAPSPLDAPDMALEAAAVKAGTLSNADVPRGAALEAAVHLVGEEPTEAARLAEELGLSYTDTMQTQKQASQKRETILHQALREEGVPPPVYDQWFAIPPAGAFDAGVARVLGEVYHLEMVQWIRNTGQKIIGSFPDVIDSLQDEVKESYGFARFATMLASGVRMGQEEGDTAEQQQAEAERDISKLAAVGFYAGWLMGIEHQEAHQGARDVRRKQQELIDLLTQKIDLGAISEDALTSKGYWTAEQIDYAKRMVRRAQYPDETNEDGSYKE